MIENVFAIPIYTTKVKDFVGISAEVNNAIEHSKFANEWQPDNDTAKTTFIPQQETNVLRKFSMEKLANEIFDNAEIYLNETKQPIKQNTVSIEQSWINIFEESQHIGTHEHGYQPNTLSGVYYHSAPSGCGNIIFKNQNPFVISFPHQSPLYSNLHTVEATEGLLILFPSWLLHKVEPNRSGKQRCSLSFNIAFDYIFYGD